MGFVCVCVWGTQTTKGSRACELEHVIVSFVQGARGLIIQLGPTKRCMMQLGKRTCRPVPGCC